MENLIALGAEVGAQLKARGETVAVAESSTGGLVCAALLSVPGASVYFQGGGVVYTLASREGLMRIAKGEMEGIRSSSEPYALLLARTARERMGATWGVGETGAAGPTGNRYGDAPGHTCIAVVGPQEKVITLETGRDDREENMWVFTRAVIDLLAECLKS
ncbi:MAG: CinA family protein [SAR324 cluster bacterium]|nr:CinA family protein [SAR324 cluster bacterium]MCZ6558484.1 CinA family protein [SAR324 cluster bacterium]MCZ6627772.1 CinA family protein [SAR324 cluster bacterium]